MTAQLISFSTALVDGGRFVLDWLEALPPARMAIATTLIASAVIAVVGTAWILLLRCIRHVRGRLTSWLERRRASRPAHEQLGIYDHADRMRGLWVDLSKVRRRLYEVLLKVGPTAKLHPSDKTYSSETLDRIERAISPSLSTIEGVARDYTRLTEMLSVTFRRVCSQAADDKVAELALKLFTEDDPPTLKSKLQEDIQILKTEWLSATLFRGKRYKLDQKLKRHAEALHAITIGSFTLIDVCDQAIQAQQRLGNQ
jgi:hypothetical protein